MDQQRHGQRGGDERGCARRLGRMAVVGMILTGACGGDLLAPTIPRDTVPKPPGTGSTASPVIGHWQNVLIIQIPEDIQSWTTVWLFDPDGLCHLTRTVRSVVAGVPFVTSRGCTYTLSAFTITVTFTDTGATQAMPFSFPASSRDRMTLEGLIYDRIP